ncbi:MAG TPA: tRNA (guanosine(37)-N1)-methyltransferase TrmD [Myxococcota bacterium]|nr:tRNA (guanosine(37)-N1)-methyltransferase TrmD [Myxococcota bacterium]HPV04841.1 tRNA (guanosine(37)-N1)-methyltransferase TrmD [Myxococcota bacterium]
MTDFLPSSPVPFRFRILSLFPQMVREAAAHSIIGRAATAGLIDIDAIDIRDFTTDRHRTADDIPFGGGPGMVMKPEPVAGAIRAAKELMPDALVVLMSASGRLFDQAMATRFASHSGGLILVCGHYEGVDERIAEHFCDMEVCVGDYVLSGGELPALTVMDATARLIPGVLGNVESLQDESHNDSMLECPQYTRPRDFEGHLVPDVLFSGNHAKIARFRRECALAKTRANRPDLVDRLEPETAPEAPRESAHDNGQAPLTANPGIPTGWGRPVDE